jgi:tricorn protease
MWSPDGKKIAYTDRLAVWYVDIEKRTPVRVAADTYDTPWRALNPSWSPDGRWLVYTPMLRSHLRAVILYSIADGTTRQISDGMSDAEFAVFDKSGKYLYFTASTNMAPATAWLDMSSRGFSVTRSLYAVVLSKDEPSPLAPESDEEKPKVKDKDNAKKADGEANAGEPKKTRIDLDGIDQRIVALPIAAADYSSVLAGKEETVFLMEHPPGTSEESAPNNIHRFDLKTRKPEKLLENVGFFDVSPNGEKMLYLQKGTWSIASTSGTPKSGEGVLKTDDMEVLIDPRAEWAQMYDEVWRIEREMFYDPGFHGLDLNATRDMYEPFLQNVVSRNDLTYLFQEMLGQFSVGHMNVEGGRQPAVRRVRGGLLGADYTIANGRYRFARVYAGENWNPQLRAPLTQPGVNVVAGEYLLAVNGRELDASQNLYSPFEDTAGKPVVLRVGGDASGTGARDVTVVPLEDEFALRNRAWMEESRRKVEQLSGGRIAYVYLPNTGQDGYINFNRYYFAQVGKEGAVIDERFNSGGSMADYVIEDLKRPLLSLWHTRRGEDFTTPQNQIFGPKALIINELCASGGDALPWMFRQQRVGPIIGKRTWGGLVGIFNIPSLMDGGFVTSPNLAFYTPGGAWEVENHGVAPDIEVENDPALWRAGHDPQLEKAVAVVLEELARHPLPKYQHPEFPNYHRAARTEISSR